MAGSSEPSADGDGSGEVLDSTGWRIFLDSREHQRSTSSRSTSSCDCSSHPGGRLRIHSFFIAEPRKLSRGTRPDPDQPHHGQLRRDQDCRHRRPGGCPNLVEAGCQPLLPTRPRTASLRCASSSWSSRIRQAHLQRCEDCRDRPPEGTRGRGQPDVAPGPPDPPRRPDPTEDDRKPPKQRL